MQKCVSGRGSALRPAKEACIAHHADSFAGDCFAAKENVKKRGGRKGRELRGKKEVRGKGEEKTPRNKFLATALNKPVT